MLETSLQAGFLCALWASVFNLSSTPCWPFDWDDNNLKHRGTEFIEKKRSRLPAATAHH